jgi:hypothetical protein
MLLVTFGLSLFILGCSNTEILEKGNIMVLQNRIPPLDAAVPTKTETATFALG